MSVLSTKTDHKVVRHIEKALRLLEEISPKAAMTKDDDFELTLAKNMLKSIIENNPKTIEIEPSN